MMANEKKKKVYVSRDQMRKGILREIQVPGFLFSGMGEDDGSIAVLYIKNLSLNTVRDFQRRFETFKENNENVLDLTFEAAAEVLCDREGNPFFTREEASQLPMLLIDALQPEILSAFGLKWKESVSENSEQEPQNQALAQAQSQDDQTEKGDDSDSNPLDKTPSSDNVTPLLRVSASGT